MRPLTDPARRVALPSQSSTMLGNSTTTVETRSGLGQVACVRRAPGSLAH